MSDLASRFSLSSCSMSTLAWNDALALAQRTGFTKLETFTTWTGCQLGPDVKPPEDVTRELADHGLTLSTLNIAGLVNHDSLARVAAEMDYARACGLATINIRGDKQGQDWGLFIELLAKTCELAKARDLTINLGNHPGNVISSAEDFMRVCNDCTDPRVRVLLDTGHFYTVGSSPFPVLEQCGDRLGLVHLNDRHEGHGTPMGEGDLDLPRLMQELARLGYDDVLVFEIEAGESPEEIESNVRTARDAVLEAAP
jgi:sugar phosphate isomerase/epimerase